jgi:hypothetical protein
VANGNVKKMAVLLGDEALAEKLVDAGLDTPKAVKAAKDADLDKAIGSTARQDIRKKDKFKARGG